MSDGIMNPSILLTQGVSLILILECSTTWKQAPLLRPAYTCSNHPRATTLQTPFCFPPRCFSLSDDLKDYIAECYRTVLVNLYSIIRFGNQCKKCMAKTNFNLAEAKKFLTSKHTTSFTIGLIKKNCHTVGARAFVITHAENYSLDLHLARQLHKHIIHRW